MLWRRLFAIVFSLFLLSGGLLLAVGPLKTKFQSPPTSPQQVLARESTRRSSHTLGVYFVGAGAIGLVGVGLGYLCFSQEGRESLREFKLFDGVELGCCLLEILSEPLWIILAALAVLVLAIAAAYGLLPQPKEEADTKT